MLCFYNLILWYASDAICDGRKINRIIEVLISSLKPFELMMGKVLGVGLVGLPRSAFG